MWGTSKNNSNGGNDSDKIITKNNMNENWGSIQK